MMQYYAIASINLKAVSKNQRSVIILDRLKDFDSGILILENWLEGVKVITSATRYYHELLNKAMETELTLDNLLSKSIKKRAICVIKEGKVSIYEDDTFDLYERAIEREFSSYVELEVPGNEFKTRSCKMYVEHLSRTWKDKADVFGPRPAEWNSNKDLVIKSTKELDLVRGLMMNEDPERVVNHSLPYCIANLVQPDGTSRADIRSVESGTRYTTVDQSIPNSRSSSHENTQLEISSETGPQINLQTYHYSLQFSVSSDSVSSVHVEPISNQNSSDVRVRVASRGNEGNSNVPHLSEGSNTESTQRPQHPLFEEYIKRVASYATFQQFALFDTVALARAGFYNTGEGTRVMCFFCGTELANLSSNDDPFLEHMRKSSSCVYLRRELEPRRLAEYQEQIRNENGVSQEANVQGVSRVTSRNPGPWTESDHIRSPQYQAYSIRLSSFARWPSDIRQSPEQVADAGFYYTGLQDVVRCFACDGGLKNWDPEDEPWIEHARWFPQCPFVKRVKGQEFIALVRRMAEDSDEDEDAVVHSTFQPNNPMADAPSLRNELNAHRDEANAENVLETDAAKGVLEAGYSKHIVARTINELITKGNVNYTSMDIMEIILEKEDRAELVTEAHGHMNPLLTPGTSDSTQSNDPVQSLIHENERLRQSMQCVECRGAKRDILLLPCTHLCLCSNCSNKASICPLCYKKINEKIKTYVI